MIEAVPLICNEKGCKHPAKFTIVGLENNENLMVCGFCKAKYLRRGVTKTCYYCNQKFTRYPWHKLVQGNYICQNCFIEIRKGNINTYSYDKKPRSLRGKNDNIYLYG